tara:strand:- start:18 stop:518 length:501 start_codon:yes stop_codon:yes gene_type:complete
LKSNYNWSVCHTTKLSNSKDELWNTISKRSNLELFHPYCKKNPYIKWDKSKSVDEVHYLNGLVYRRNFCDWIESVGYDLLIGENEKDMSYVSWRIKGNDSVSELTITVYPYIFNRSSKIFDLLPFFLIIKPGLKKYLKNIGLGLNYYFKYQKPVTKNQFSSHKWFS